jgi:hypothetical protein
MRPGRVRFLVEVIADLDDPEMVENAEELIESHISNCVEYHTIELQIIPDSTLTEHDITDVLMERRDEHEYLKAIVTELETIMMER